MRRNADKEMSDFYGVYGLTLRFCIQQKLRAAEIRKKTTKRRVIGEFSMHCFRCLKKDIFFFGGGVTLPLGRQF